MIHRFRAAGRIFPLTPGGLALVGLAAASLYFYGFERSDLVISAIAAVGLALGACAVAVVVVTAAAVAWSLRRRPPGDALDVETGREFATGFSMLHPWFVPWVAVDWTWHDPEADVRIERIGGRLHEAVALRRRGEFTEVKRWYEVADPLGIARVRFAATERRAVRGVPGTGRLDRVPTASAFAGGDHLPHPEAPAVGDRFDLRRYHEGDPIRFVLWKVYARTRELVVRQPERAYAPAQQVIAYLVAGPSDEPAAGAARVATMSGSLGSKWEFGADGSDGIAADPADALEQIVGSGRVAAEEGGGGLASFLARVGRPGARAVVFVPAVRGAWIPRVAQAIRPYAGQVELLVCTDAGASRPPPAWRRWMFETDAVPTHEVAEVVAALSGLGARVTVVDRSAGRIVPAEVLRRAG